ncbi:MAG: pyridoxal-phosphate dependent enzyme [Anaerolineae bacterium]|nr:pyridoxal-phosphate dependent enzyme [Anaerolineae bacterium]
MSSHLIVECLECGHQTQFHPRTYTCPKCDSPWREARYDYETIANGLTRKLATRPFDLWRYSELLPLRKSGEHIILGEGGTPLIPAVNLGMMLGCHNLFIKDERHAPTRSFKDRQAAITISALKEADITEAVIASTGNVAISYSAYAARAGIKLWVFLTSLVPAAKMREVALYGSQVIKVTGSYDQAKKIAAEFARQRNLYLDQGAKSILCIESMKTISFELAEQLTELLGPPQDAGSLGRTAWRSPDWYIQSVSGGMGPLGVLKGFEELQKMGMIQQVPKIAAIQTEGCAPMVHAWKLNQDSAMPIQSPRTLIATLATGDPGKTYTLLRQKMQAASGGIMESVTDEEAFRAMHFLAKMEGVSMEPAAGVAFAGLIKLVRAGVIKSQDVVVINCSGHTMPIERNILGESWSRDLIVPSQAMEDSGIEEGLLAALSKVAIDRFPRIAIVDDHPDVRRLIRRILQAQGNYTLFEAENGREAIELARKEHPDLIILDLMMPEMDGFSVLDALKSSSETADIPVIVVTAKELTTAEKERLKGHIQSLMQKGDFMSDELLDEVRALLR